MSTSTPFLGYGYFTEANGSRRVWLHNTNVESDGSFVDSARPLTERCFGIKWGAELYQAIPKRPGARMGAEELPPVLRTPAYIRLGTSLFP